jgi:hypothetical protein
MPDPIATGATFDAVNGGTFAGGLFTDAVTLPAGAVGSLFLVQTFTDSGVPGQPPLSTAALLACLDSRPDPSAIGFTACRFSNSETSSYVVTRFANFLADPDAPALDVCARYHGYHRFLGPLLNGPRVAGDAGAADAGAILAITPLPGGSNAGPVSQYFGFPGPYQYDVRFVAAGSGSCSAPVLPEVLLDSPSISPMIASKEITFAAIGLRSAPPDAGTAFRYAAFADENFIADGARVVHVDATHPAPLDVAASTLGFRAVEYGAFGTQPAGADDAGYRPLPAPVDGGAFIVRATTTGATVGSFLYSTASFHYYTFFLAGTASAGAPTPHVVQCDDTEIDAVGLFPCTALEVGP